MLAPSNTGPIDCMRLNRSATVTEGLKIVLLSRALRLAIAANAACLTWPSGKGFPTSQLTQFAATSFSMLFHAVALSFRSAQVSSSTFS